MWFRLIKSWYTTGIWTAEDVQRAVPKRITQEQADEILALEVIP